MPLFLLWIYISWNIVLLSAVVVHSLSAYRGDVQAQRPALLKALEVLQVLWQRQGEGRSVGELELLGRGPLVLDSESWQWLRDLLLSKRVITQDERGRYLLARDLHTVRVAELLEWVGGDTQVPAEDRGLPAWEQRAVNLLRQRYARDRELFDLSIAGLFSQ